MATIRIKASEAKSYGIPPTPRKAKQTLKQDKKTFEASFSAQCEAWGLPVPTFEFKFHTARKWAFDVAWLKSYAGVSNGNIMRFALEIEGGVWSEGGGRHNRGKGFLGDLEKYNAAALAGWIVLRCVPKDVESGAVFGLLRRAFYGEDK